MSVSGSIEEYKTLLDKQQVEIKLYINTINKKDEQIKKLDELISHFRKLFGEDDNLHDVIVKCKRMNTHLCMRLDGFIGELAVCCTGINVCQEDITTNNKNYVKIAAVVNEIKDRLLRLEDIDYIDQLKVLFKKQQKSDKKIEILTQKLDELSKNNKKLLELSQKFDEKLSQELDEKISKLSQNYDEKLLELSQKLEEKLSQNYDDKLLELSQKFEEKLSKLSVNCDEKLLELSQKFEEFDKKLSVNCEKKPSKNYDEKLLKLSQELDKFYEKISANYDEKLQKLTENNDKIEKNVKDYFSKIHAKFDEQLTELEHVKNLFSSSSLKTTDKTSTIVPQIINTQILTIRNHFGTIKIPLLFGDYISHELGDIDVSTFQCPRVIFESQYGITEVPMFNQ